MRYLWPVSLNFPRLDVVFLLRRHLLFSRLDVARMKVGSFFKLTLFCFLVSQVCISLQNPFFAAHLLQNLLINHSVFFSAVGLNLAFLFPFFEGDRLYLIRLYAVFDYRYMLYSKKQLFFCFADDFASFYLLLFSMIKPFS